MTDTHWRHLDPTPAQLHLVAHLETTIGLGMKWHDKTRGEVSDRITELLTESALESAQYDYW